MPAPTSTRGREPTAGDLPWAPAIVAGLAALGLYLALLAPVSGDKDASEFTLVLSRRGVAHPTGYPLFTLLGHGFVQVLHACGASWAWAANAWSSLGGAVAIGLLVRLAQRLTDGAAARPGLGGSLALLGPVALFATNPMWTQETTVAEVYSWHVAWVAGFASWFVGRMRDADGERPLGVRQAFEWGAWGGVGLAHHLTALLVYAPLAATLGWRRRRSLSAGSRWLALALGAALPLLAYSWIAHRAFHPGEAQWPLLEPRWGSVLAHCTGRQYRGYLGSYNPSEAQERYLGSFVYPLLVLAAVAVARSTQRTHGPARAVPAAIAAAVLLGTAWAFSYGAIDPSSYFQAPVALGMATAGAVLARLAGPRARGARAALGLAGGIAVAGLAVAGVDRALDRRETYRRFDALVRSMWRSIPHERGLVLWADDMYLRLHEYQELDGEKPELEVENPWHLANDAPRAAFAARHGFDPMAGLALRLRRDGTLVGGERAADLLFEEMAARINASSPLPVVVFDPRRQSVRLLRKPQPQP